ncbi:MAG: preprotein translocase subunit SecG [Desulfovibrionaceae bacterium]|nr:preprotein translocase subunit SecG [Desulfovibrionaceae bacterium]
MQSLLLTLHIIVCVLLVILILLQSGKEGMGVIFGGGNSTLFGSTGAGGILVKLTTFMALIFVVTSLSYTYVTSSHTEKESVILDVQIENSAPAAVTPKGSDVPAQDTAKTENAKEENAQEKSTKEENVKEENTEKPKDADKQSPTKTTRPTQKEPSAPSTSR